MRRIVDSYSTGETDTSDSPQRSLVEGNAKPCSRTPLCPAVLYCQPLESLRFQNE
jgi:hypothetical protein